MTVLELITDSLRKCSAIRKGEAPGADEVQDALSVLTRMLRLWAARRLMVRAVVQENFPTVDGTGSYTIGVGGTINTSKPLRITSVTTKDSNGVVTPMDMVDRDSYDSHMDRFVSTARPRELFYDPGLSQQMVQTGTINLYPIPDAVYTVYINGLKPFTGLTTFAEDVTFEGVYEEPIICELAIRLWGEYHDPKVPVPLDLRMQAADAMRVLENINSIQPVASMDIPSSGRGAYNIYTGGYNG